jgi:hypothetical protein
MLYLNLVRIHLTTFQCDGAQWKDMQKQKSPNPETPSHTLLSLYLPASMLKTHVLYPSHAAKNNTFLQTLF